jgi:hypothetical protein
MRSTVPTFTVLALLSLAACATDSTEGPLPGGGKADDGNWVEVDECVGWDLCLANIVVAQDLTDFESQPQYPMVLSLDIVSEPRNLTISENCAGHLDLDAQQNLICSPDGVVEDTFVVARFKSKNRAEGTEWIRFDYEGPGRAKLLRDESSTTGEPAHLLVIE